MLVTWSKGHVWEPLTLCKHLAYFGVDTSSACRIIYFICHVIQQDHFLKMSCVFMGDSSSSHVTTLKSVVSIGILIVKRKNASSITSYKYVLAPKNWVDWTTTGREKKNVANKNGIFWEEVPRNVFKKTHFSLYD